MKHEQKLVTTTKSTPKDKPSSGSNSYRLCHEFGLKYYWVIVACVVGFAY